MSDFHQALTAVKDNDVNTINRLIAEGCNLHELVDDSSGLYLVTKLAYENDTKSLNFLKRFSIIDINHLVFGFALAGNYDAAKFYYLRNHVNFTTFVLGFIVSGNTHLVVRAINQFKVEPLQLAIDYVKNAMFLGVESICKLYGLDLYSIVASLAQEGNLPAMQFFYQSFPGLYAETIIAAFARQGFPELGEEFYNNLLDAEKVNTRCKLMLAVGLTESGHNSLVDEYLTTNKLVLSHVIFGYALVGNSLLANHYLNEYKGSLASLLFGYAYGGHYDLVKSISDDIPNPNKIVEIFIMGGHFDCAERFRREHDIDLELVVQFCQAKGLDKQYEYYLEQLAEPNITGEVAAPQNPSYVRVASFFGPPDRDPKATVDFEPGSKELLDIMSVPAAVQSEDLEPDSLVAWLS